MVSVEAYTLPEILRTSLKVSVCLLTVLGDGALGGRFISLGGRVGAGELGISMSDGSYGEGGLTRIEAAERGVLLISYGYVDIIADRYAGTGCSGVGSEEGKGTIAAGLGGGTGFFSGERDFLFSCECPLLAGGGAAVGKRAPFVELDLVLA